MKVRISTFVMSIIMLVMVFVAEAMPASAAKNTSSKTTTTTAKSTVTTTSSESKQLYVVPFKDNFTAIRETPNLNDKHPLQIMAYSRGEYCIYTGEDVTVKNDAGKTEKWYKVNTVFGQPGYVINWAGKVVSEKPTRPTTTTTALSTATNKATSTTKAVSTTKKTTSTTKTVSTTKKTTSTTKTVSTTKKTTSTTKTVSTTKKTTTSTTAKPTTTELFYLTSKSYTNIRLGKSTKTAKLGVVREKDVAVADKKEGNWYHLISLNGNEKLGWCQANLMKEIPSPTTTITTTASKPTTTTAKKTMTTTSVKNTTTTTKPSTTTTKKTTTTTKANFLYFDLGKGGKTRLDDVKIVNRTKIQVGFSYDPNSNTLYIDSVG